MGNFVGVRAWKNGPYWTLAWYDGNGEIVRESAGRVSAEDAERLRHEREVSLGLDPTARQRLTQMDLATFRTHYPSLREGEIHARTLGLHDVTLGYLVDHFGAGRKMSTVEPIHAQQWVGWLRRLCPPLSETTVANHVRTARQLWRKAKAWQVVRTNPFEGVSVPAPKVEKSWHYVSLTDAEKLMTACTHESWRLLFGLCRLAGLRSGEATAVEWGHWDRQNGTLAVWPREGRRTSKQRLRYVPVVPRLRTLLEASNGTTGPIVRLPIGYPQHKYLVQQIELAGLDAWAKPLHTLRKNLESDWMAQFPPMAVAYWLGNSVEVAMEHYYKPTPDLMAKATGVA